MEQKLLGLSLKYDPYSPTAEEDYLALKASVADIDIVGILSNEVAKAAKDQTLTRQALNALRALEVAERERSLSILPACWLPNIKEMNARKSGRWKETTMKDHWAG